MQRTSETIGTIAAALAKAQAELINPEKSLVATIRADGPGAVERSFRYAPLSSGLDIVRKTLSQHEIATVQTTALDQTSGIVNLTTVLAHASGEWIASDWPVCTISETATPHRMGAALTYARRYALFTLVGIAGEDDLDAPDIATPTQKTPGLKNPVGTGNGRFANGQHKPTPRAPVQRTGNVRSNAAELGPEASAELRDRLLGELNGLNSGDDAALWAHRHLPEKNKLNAADAERVEEAFRTKLATFGPSDTALPDIAEKMQQPTTSHNAKLKVSAKRSRSNVINKSVLALPEPRRARDREHIRHVAKQPCLICGRRPSDPHHLRFAQSRALGRKSSDEFTVPLCRGHHREIHRSGDEATWWKNAGVDPTVAARALWLQTHPLATAPDTRSIQLLSAGFKERAE